MQLSCHLSHVVHLGAKDGGELNRPQNNPDLGDEPNEGNDPDNGDVPGMVDDASMGDSCYARDSPDDYNDANKQHLEGDKHANHK